MRRDCAWFSDRAAAIWRAQPARSMLLLVPQGCDETAASALVKKWTESNFKLPAAYGQHKPVCVSLTSDSMQSCVHFANTFARRLCRPLNIRLEADPDDYPTDIMQLAVESLLDAGFYPIIVIERFHAFALIKDSGMTSVLSGMRSLEHAGQLTTLAFSPLTYTMIRRLMLDGQPFLNSVYGDNHDQAVMTPLSREDFVQYAIDRGISVGRANWLYVRGGGPDAIYSALIDASSLSDSLIIEDCIDRVGDTIDKFLERSFAAGVEEQELILSTLAVGRLLKQQVSFLVSNPLSPFLMKTTSSGDVVCSSQILARKILRRDQPKWSLYGACLDALGSGEYQKAGDLANCLDDKDLRLTAFKNLVLLRSAISSKPGFGLLGIDWGDVGRLASSIIECGSDIPGNVIEWVKRVGSWSDVVVKQGEGAINRLQVDALTSVAADKDVRLVILYMVGSFVREVSALASPSHRILHLVNIPEAILQAIASGFCEIDFKKPADPFPEAEYGKFFSGVSDFVIPVPNQKMALNSLLVVVPALLSVKELANCDVFIDTKNIKALQQKLVDCVRNPASHTIVDFLEKDAVFLLELCRAWIDSWIRMEGFQSFDDLPGVRDTPTPEDIAAMLLG